MSQVSQQNLIPLKTRIYIDFWNYEVTMQELAVHADGAKFLTNWFALPNVLIAEASRVICPTGPQFLQYDKCVVVGSYVPTTDTGLFNWANTILAKVPGVIPIFLPRVRKLSGPRCTGLSHHEVRTCPTCQASMLGYQEKGIDTRIATEMLDAGLQDSCDVIILVSADKDFIPVVDKLAQKNVKCINAFFPHRGNELANKCWGRFNLFDVRNQFKR